MKPKNKENYRSAKRNALRAQGKLGKNLELAKRTYHSHPELIDWPTGGNGQDDSVSQSEVAEFFEYRR